MAVRDVPVDAGQNLGVLLVSRENWCKSLRRSRTCPSDGCTPSPYPTSVYGTPYLCLFTVLTRAILYNLSRSLLFVVHEEEQLVLDDGTAQREAVGSLGLIGTCSQVLAVDAVTAHVLVAVIGIGSTSERVRTTLGDGIDAAADEVRLAHVEGATTTCTSSMASMEMGFAAAGKVGTKSEVIVEVGTVDR